MHFPEIEGTQWQNPVRFLKLRFRVHEVPLYTSGTDVHTNPRAERVANPHLVADVD